MEGQMATDKWIKDDDGSYYVDSSGEMKTGWIGENYLNGDGTMQKRNGNY